MRKIDNDRAGLTLFVFDGGAPAIALLELSKQWQRIVIVHEAHDFARTQSVEGPENRGMAETFGDASRIENVDLVGGKMQMRRAHEMSL